MPTSPAELASLLTFAGLKPAPRTLEAVQQAVARLRDPAQEGREAVSWFRLENTADQEAYAALLAGNPALALQIWEKAAMLGELKSAEENLAVLHHIQALANPDEPAVWVEALAWLSQAASGGNVHRQDVCARVVAELTSQIKASAAQNDSRRLMQLLHMLVPYLEEPARHALEQDLFKTDLDRLRLECADLRGQLLKAQGEAGLRVSDLEKTIGTQVVPQVERLLQTGLPGPSELASREAALIYRSLGRTWAVRRDRKERCLALESAVRYATPELRSELLAELESARLDKDEVERVSTPPPSAEQVPPPKARGEFQHVMSLPGEGLFLGTGLRLRKSGPGAHYDANYEIALLGLPLIPIRRYQVYEEFPGSPSSIIVLPPTLMAQVWRVLVVFVLGLSLLAGAGYVSQHRNRQLADAQRLVLSRQIDELLDKVSNRAQRLHHLELELEECKLQEDGLEPGPSLGAIRARKAKLKEDHARLKSEHQELIAKLFRLEQKRQALR